MLRVLVALLAIAAAAAPCAAVDVPITAKKLLIVDKIAKAGRAKLVFVTKDANVDKGVASDPAALSGRFEVFYADAPSNNAVFALSSPWLKNTDKVAKYRNKTAPTGGGVKVGIVKPGKKGRIVAKSLGDSEQIDLFAGPPGPNGIVVEWIVENAADGSTIRMCSRFAAADVEIKEIAKGTGRKLKARNGQPASCGTSISMQPDLSGGFLAHPWPNDIRRMGDGSIDLTGYPGTSAIPILGTVLSNGAASTFGFGTNSAVYFQSTGMIDTGSLPSADETTLVTSPVLLVNLDDPSEPPAPLLVDFNNSPTSLRPGNLLTLLPYPGHPLHGQTRYAAIILDGVLDGQGFALRPAPLIAELDGAWDAEKPVGASEWSALQDQRDDVLDYVSTWTSWDPEQVVGFTVFTTQDVTSEMLAIEAAVEALPSPTPVSRSAGSCGGLAATVTGELDLPKWQEGTFPYFAAGGAIVVDNGVAVQQSTERVDFELTYPCGPAPAEGWPILLYMNGTGACPDSAFITELGHSRVSSPLPYVVASISPLYSCERDPGLGNSEYVFFNFINPVAGRTNQMQQAADMLYLRRIAEGIVLSAAETGSPIPVETNDDVVVIAGHSQGALTVPHALAADPSLHAGFISAGGGGLYLTLWQRADVRDLLDTLAGQSLAELDIFHPLLHAVQTLAEVGDAANYGALIQNAHVLSIGGSLDGCSPLEVVNTLGTSLGLEVANPILHPLFGSSLLEPPATSLPAAANLSDGRTGLTVELSTGHFGAQANPTLGRSFMDSSAAGGVPAVTPNPLVSDAFPGCPRYAPLQSLP